MGGTFGHSRSDVFAGESPEGGAEGPADGAEETRGAPAPEIGARPGRDVVAQDASAVAGPEELPRAGAEGAGKAVDGAARDADAVPEKQQGNAEQHGELVAVPVPASTPRGRNERDLRNAYANADTEDVSQAALDLGGYLVQRERHFEALFVIDQALKRSRTVPLRLARAGLLRDLARCDLAASELQSVVRELGAKKVSPATLFDLAQAEWVAGQTDAAAATLRSIPQAHAGDVWLQDHADDLAAWDARIRDAAPGRDPLANGELRDLFALLRAAPDSGSRLKMLDALAGKQRESDPAYAERRPVRLRAIAIACADEATAVRARAVHLARVHGLRDPDFWGVALADPAPLVRRFAATGAAEHLGRAATSVLFEQLQRERDPAAFASLHRGLATVFAVAAPACEADTDEGRAAAVAHWRELCER